MPPFPTADPYYHPTNLILYTEVSAQVIVEAGSAFQSLKVAGRKLDLQNDTHSGWRTLEFSKQMLLQDY